MAKKIPTAAVLRPLRETMREFETQRQKCLAQGDNPADIDRDVAQAALTSVVDFFLDHGIETESLYRLLCDLEALSAGASPSRMLLPAKTHHRRPDSPTIEGMKGRLAAIMEYRQATLHLTYGPA
jgi:hypothetical protein